MVPNRKIITGLVVFFIFSSWLSACQSSLPDVPPSETSLPSPTNTAVPSSTITATVTSTPTTTPRPTYVWPTPTPTVIPPISETNINKLRVETLIGQGELKTLRYSRDGSYFIVVGSKKTCTFNPLTLEEILCIETLSEIVKKGELSLNRELLVEERINGVLIHDLRTGTKIFSANCTLPNVFSSNLSRSGKYLGVVSHDKQNSTVYSLEIWDVPANKRIAKLDGLAKQSRPEFSGDETQVLLSDPAKGFKFYNFLTDEYAEPITLPGQKVSDFTLSPNGELLAISINGETGNYQSEPTSDGDVIIYSTLEKIPVWRTKGVGPIRQMVFSPDGRYFAFAARNRVISVRSTADWFVVNDLYSTVGFGYSGLRFSEDSAYLFAAAGRWNGISFNAAKLDFPLLMWDITQSNPLLSLSDSTWTNSAEVIDVSADNSLVSAISCVELGTWKIDPLEQLASRPFQFSSPASVFSNDGKYLFISFTGGQVSAWNIKENRFDYTLGKPSYALVNEYRSKLNIRRIIISPDGHYLATVGTDDNLRIWDLQTQTLLTEKTLIQDPIEFVFSPGSDQLAVVSGSKYLPGAGVQSETRINIINLRDLQVGETLYVYGKQNYGQFNDYLPFFVDNDNLKLLTFVNERYFSLVTLSDIMQCFTDNYPGFICKGQELPNPVADPEFTCNDPFVNLSQKMVGGICHRWDDYLSYWNFEDFELISSTYICPSLRELNGDIALSNDGNFSVFVASSYKKGDFLQFLDPETGNFLRKIETDMSNYPKVMFSPDGYFLTVLGNPIQLWRIYP